MPTSLKKTLEKAESDLLTEVKEWLRAASPDQMREVLTVLLDIEDVEEEEVDDEDAPDRPHAFVTLQEFAVTWAQLNNLLVQVEAAEPEDDEEEGDDDTAEAEKSGAETAKSAAPQKVSGRKTPKHRHCCEIGKHEAEAAERKSSHAPPASV